MQGGVRLCHIVELARGEVRLRGESAGWAENPIRVVFATRDSSDLLRSFEELIRLLPDRVRGVGDRFEGLPGWGRKLWQVWREAGIDGTEAEMEGIVAEKAVVEPLAANIPRVNHTKRIFLKDARTDICSKIK